MKCPVKHNGFARLPGQTFDDSARLLSRRLADKTGKLLENVLNDVSQEVPTGEYDLQTVAYGAAGLVIEQLWERLNTEQTKLILKELKVRHAHGSYEERVEKFMRCLLGLLMARRDQFFNELKDRGSTHGADVSYEDKLFLVFGVSALKYKPETKGVPVPSFNDLVVFFGRMAIVAPLTFERDIGRSPSGAEVLEMLRSPFMLGFTTELMANSREAALPLIARLEGFPQGDLNSIERRFGPQFFKVGRVVERYTLRVKEEIAAEYRENLEKASKGHDPSRALGCPALYAGKFREIYYWVCTSFEDWMAPA